MQLINTYSSLNRSRRLLGYDITTLIYIIYGLH